MIICSYDYQHNKNIALCNAKTRIAAFFCCRLNYCSVVVPSKCSSSAIAASLAACVTPSRCSAGE